MNNDREFYKNTFHHLYNRGANKNKIFFEREDYLFFLRKIKQYKTSFEIDILCYCLMPNHFHIFVKQLTDNKTIGKFVGSLINSYTKSINKKYNRSGVLFESGTKNKIINNESYFKWVCKYILVNPVQAKLVNIINDWEFSSARDYLNVRKGELNNKKIILSHFNSYDIFKEFLFDKKEVDYSF
jgi:REP element-mobilizing transposase RayT